MNRKARRAGQSGTNRPAPVQRRERVDPAFIGTFLDEGWRLLSAGNDEQALEIAGRAIRLQETPDSQALFVECIKRWCYFPGAEELSDLVARALQEFWAAPADLAGIVGGLLDHDPVVGPAIRRASEAWPLRLPLSELLGTPGLAAVSQNSLLQAWIQSGRLFGTQYERFLTTIRAGLLELAGGDRPPDGADVIALACALARQCYINEYIYDLAPGELERTEQLRNRIGKALAEQKKLPPFCIAVLGAYFEIHNLSLDERAVRSWPPCLKALLADVTQEAVAQSKHRETMPRLTAINDDVSAAVRQQYEENPYPRWTQLPPAMPPCPVDDGFRRSFPSSAYRPMGQSNGVDILIAGCGTGHHSILFARSFLGARTLAVDLSLSSLSYAKEKSRAMGFTGIEYAQADILELAQFDRRFDIISSSGVLHHLGDAEKGWRVLLSLLQPDGCMHVGLYSELACRNISAARDWLAARGYTGSTDDIRRAREDLASAAEHDPRFADVLHCPDFYSTSECRDLLFHTQERRFTIPQIQSFIESQNLQFLGFTLGRHLFDQFHRQFPGGREDDLALWHSFENTNPDTFKGMYQFWVQRRC